MMSNSFPRTINGFSLHNKKSCQCALDANMKLNNNIPNSARTINDIVVRHLNKVLA